MRIKCILIPQVDLSPYTWPSGVCRFCAELIALFPGYLESIVTLPRVYFLRSNVRSFLPNVQFLTGPSSIEFSSPV